MDMLMLHAEKREKVIKEEAVFYEFKQEHIAELIRNIIRSNGHEPADIIFQTDYAIRRDEWGENPRTIARFLGVKAYIK